MLKDMNGFVPRFGPVAETLAISTTWSGMGCPNVNGISGGGLNAVPSVPFRKTVTPLKIACT